MIQILTGERFLVECQEELSWSLDGESSGPRKQARICAMKGRLTLQG